MDISEIAMIYSHWSCMIQSYIYLYVFNKLLIGGLQALKVRKDGLKR